MTTLAEVLAKNRDMLNEVRPVLLVGVDSAGVPTAGTFDASGQLIVAASAGAAKTVVANARHLHLTPVTTSAWTQLVASAGAAISSVQVWDSSGQTLELGTGLAGAEARVCLIPPGGIEIDVIIASGARISVKAVSANTATGELILQGVG
jgi:hypothetical protein